MASACEIQRRKVDAMVVQWLEKNTGRWVRIVDVSRGVGFSNSAVTESLLRLKVLKIVQREEQRKQRNGKRYPVYMACGYKLSDGPSWFNPKPPAFNPGTMRVRMVVDGKESS